MSSDPKTHKPPKAGSVVFDDAAWADGFTVFPNTVIRAPHVEPDTKMLLLMILSYAWQDNSAFPSLETLAHDLHRSERWVWGQIRELVARNILIIESGGVGKANTYHITKASTWDLSDTVKPAKDPRNRLHLITLANACERNTPASDRSHTPASAVRTRLPSKKTQVTKTHIEKDAVVGADKPRRAPDPDLERISTEHDPDAPACRRLALDLARTILDWDTVGAGTLRRFDGYYKARLEQPHDPRYDDAETRLMAFNEWLVSNGYWAEHAHMFNDAQMSKEWNDWVGKGEPKRKPCPKGQVRR